MWHATGEMDEECNGGQKFSFLRNHVAAILPFGEALFL